MKLQQLRYIWQVSCQDLNISAVANSLHTSQPGISKQIRMLEDELAVKIFYRRGKKLTGVTPVGRSILDIARGILDQVENIQNISNEFNDPEQGTLTIATTHTQARYLLPNVIRQFIKCHPKISFNMHQGTPLQIAESVSQGKVDIAIATEALDLFDNLIMLPCYRWNRSVIVPHDHPLASSKKFTLKQLAEYPIITYILGFTGRAQLDAAFNAQGYKPNIVFTASDADVIKTYVKLGVGIGIVASMAFDPIIDHDLIAIDASHLFPKSVTVIGFRKGVFLRGFIYQFIELFAPHLNKQLVDLAIKKKTAGEIKQLFRDIKLKSY